MNPVVTNAPIYLDWSFWAVVIAVFAVVLSQVPPLRSLLRRPRLQLELFSRVFVSHKVGSPWIQAQLILRNTGGRPLRVKSIKLAVVRDGSVVASLAGIGYLQNPSDANAVLLTSFPIEAKREWNHIVNFVVLPSRVDENRYRTAEARLKDDIFEKRKHLPDNQLAEANPELVEPFLKLFHDRFVWNPGEYEIRFLFEVEPRTVDLQKRYRFVIFESDTGVLSEFVDGYKFGDGIYFETGKHKGIFAQINE